MGQFRGTVRRVEPSEALERHDDMVAVCVPGVHGAVPFAASVAAHVADEAVSPATVVSFESVFAEMYPSMVSLASSLLASRALAQEVVQDAFAKAFERWSRLENPGGFVRTCVVNACRSQWRREVVLRKITPKLVASTPVSVEDRHDAVLDAVRRLAPKRRAVVLLRFYEGCSEAEIAELLSMPKGTVKSTLHRALADLRGVLVDMEGVL